MPIPRERDYAAESEPHMDMRMLEFVERRREEQAQARRQRIQMSAILVLGLVAILLAASNVVLVSRLVARPVAAPAVAQRAQEVPDQTAAEADREPPVTTAPAEAERSRQADRAATGDRPGGADRAPSAERPSSAERAPAERAPSVEQPSAPDRARATARRAEPPPAVDAAPPARGREAERPVREAERPVEDVRPPAAASRPDRTPALPARVAPERSGRAASPPRAADVVESRASRSASASPDDAEPDVDSAQRTARWLVRTYGPAEAETRAASAAQFYGGEERVFWRRVLSHVRALR